VDTDELKCTECGQPLPPDAPPGICPACAFSLALASDQEIETEATVKMLVGPHEFSTRRPRSSSILWPISRFGHWPFIILFIVLTVYTLGRIAWSQTHPKPSLLIDRGLHVIFDLDDYGVQPDSQLTEVNGVPVNEFADVNKALVPDALGRFEMVFERPNGESNKVTWLPFSPTLAFHVEPPGELTLEPGDSFPQLPLGLNEKIVAVNGMKLEEIVEKGLVAEDLVGLRTRFSLGDSNGNPTGVEFVVQRFPWSLYWGRYAAGIALGVVGITGFGLRPASRSAQTFLIFCLYLSVWWFSRAIPMYNKLFVERMVYMSLQAFIIVPSILFLFTFTPLRSRFRALPRWMVGAAVIALVLLITNMVIDWRAAALGFMTRWVFLVWACLMLAFIIISVSVDFFLGLRGRNLNPTDKQRANVIRLGILAGFLPLGIHTAVRFFFDPHNYAFFAEITVLLFPVIILYAIVRHNLLNLNELVREGVLYSLLLIGISASYAAFAGFVTPFVDEKLGAEYGWVRASLVASIVFVAFPVHSRARKLLDSRMSQVPKEYETFISDLEKVDSHAAPLEYCQYAVEHLVQITGSQSILMLTHFENRGGWSISAVRPSARSGQTIARCTLLLKVLEVARQPIFRDDLLENDNYQDHRDSLIDGISSLDAEVLLPLVGRDRVVGAIALGAKKRNKNYTGAELRSLMRIADQIALRIADTWDRPESMVGKRIVDMIPFYPETIGPYEIDGVLGQGGMSHVLLGHTDEHHVALKFANRMVQSSPRQMERFHREASAIQRVDHPNVVKVLEVDWYGSEPYIVMEYFEQGSVDQLLVGRAGMDEVEALKVIVDTAKGLKAALEQNIVHRDIKPRNLFIGDDGTVKVGDFGLALLEDMPSLTTAGEIFGTPEYISPEIATGERAHWRSDQYALGITLYHLLTGHCPFTAEKFDAVLYQHIHKAVPDVRVRRKDIRQPINTLIKRMLAKDPDARFGSYDILIDALDQASQHVDA